ncbi:MAG: RNA-binding protein [Citrobacter freundii]|nr:MAG: RNA-binding protein [Citrobacter freundii]
MNLYVANFGFDFNDETLKQLFTSFGEVLSAKVIHDRDTGRSRGFGFVEIQTDEAGNNAIASLNNKDVNGRLLSVTLAKQKAKGPVRNVWM